MAKETTMCDNDGGHTILCPYPGKSIIRARCQESPITLLDDNITELLPDGTACLPDGKGTRGKMWCMIWNLHSSLGRWHLCCWGHPGHLLGYSGGAPAGWRLSYYSRSGSRSWQWSPPNWTNQHNRRRSNDCGNTTYQQWFFYKARCLTPQRKYNTLRFMQDELRCVSAQTKTDPEANRSLTGFQAQMKTSDSWPLSTVALLAGISTSTSISIGSLWLSEEWTDTYFMYINIHAKHRFAYNSQQVLSIV